MSKRLVMPKEITSNIQKNKEAKKKQHQNAKKKKIMR